MIRRSKLQSQRVIPPTRHVLTVCTRGLLAGYGKHSPHLPGLVRSRVIGLARAVLISGVPRLVLRSATFFASLTVAAAAFALSNLALADDLRKGDSAIETLSPQTQENWERKAVAGDPIAQNVTGMAYKYGIGVPQDHATSILWFHLAAEQGEADAQFNLASIYDSRADDPYKKQRAAPADDAEAFKWYRRSAEQGHVPAQVKVARLYAEGGAGIKRDSVQAYRWLYAASLSGDLTAGKLLTRYATGMTAEQVREGKRLAQASRSRQRSD